MSFKPYYKWITFNTLPSVSVRNNIVPVLNLIINGLPSIRKMGYLRNSSLDSGFKPYYKWITFNTENLAKRLEDPDIVLNLIINGLPSIRKIKSFIEPIKYRVLNLIINGLPSIPLPKG